MCAKDVVGSVKKLDVYRNSIQVHIVHELVEYDPEGGIDVMGKFLEESIIRLVPVYPWLAPIIKCMDERKKHEDYLQ